jgi:tetratricopeptide (TPR) repeat protein
VPELKDLPNNPQSLANWPFTTKLVEVGLYGAHSGQVAAAKILFEGLLMAAPDLVRAKIGLAFTQLVTNDFEQAVASLKEIILQRPDDSEAEAILALALSLSGNFYEAEPILNKLEGSDGPAAELARQLKTR